MLVSELEPLLSNDPIRSIPTSLGNFEVTDDASHLKLKDSEEQFPVDELLEAHLAQFLDIPKTYLAKCPPVLKYNNLNTWLDQKKESSVTLEVVGGNITAIHRPEQLMIPISDVAKIITKTFKPHHEVVDITRDTNYFRIDVTTDHQIEVPNPHRIPHRPEEGDITKGGMRFIAYTNPKEAQAPVLTEYLHRVFCRNGMTDDYGSRSIKLRGKTVSEILVEMEQVAQGILGRLDEKLAEYAALNDRPMPEDRTAFAYQLGNEFDLGKRVLDRVVERVNILPDEATMFDLQQVYTELANDPGVSDSTKQNLQQLGGSVAFDYEHLTHRCGSCQRLLPDHV